MMDGPLNMAVNSQPITILRPQIDQIIGGRCSALHRPMTYMARRWAIGQRLWIREPFRMAARFDAIRPTDALERGAQFYFGRALFPVFAKNLHSIMVPASGLGRQRMAREMPKAIHRHHLVITALDPRPLHAISDEDIMAEGFRDREAYAQSWDKNTSFSASWHKDIKWAANLDIMRLSFTYQDQPIPGHYR